MIDFDELCEEFYIDLNGRVVSVNLDDNAYRIAFECDDWHRHDFRRRFELVFDNVREVSVRPSECHILDSADEHPALWQHNDEQVSMFFSTAPSDPLELIGLLYEAHTRICGRWRQLADYLHADSELLLRGHGLLAKGPKRVIDEYARVIGDRLRYTILSDQTPRERYRVILFDETFVVCQSVSVIEQPLA